MSPRFRPATRRAEIEGVLRIAAGCGLLQLTSNASRSDALRFYKGAGFTPSHIGFKKPL